MTLSKITLEKLILPLLVAMTETEVGKRIRPNQPRVIKEPLIKLIRGSLSEEPRLIQ
ncbi:MAG: hypothetical protein KAH20_10820 [Methylococcales bacterium]|nr:hypothetical protein [Methylococcales bacterium]